MRHVSQRAPRGLRTRLRRSSVLLMAGLSLSLVLPPIGSGLAQEGEQPKSIRKTCGSCPEGYAMTGVTTAPEICKDGDPVLVQCVPLGANMLPVCGSCPESYVEIGRSSVPARCGNREGGLLSQCQLKKMESNLPDPTQGGIQCPPNCGSTPAPGQGGLPPPQQFRPAPETK
jgi:hypothetical protein